MIRFITWFVILIISTGQQSLTRRALSFTDRSGLDSIYWRSQLWASFSLEGKSISGYFQAWRMRGQYLPLESPYFGRLILEIDRKLRCQSILWNGGWAREIAYHVQPISFSVSWHSAELIHSIKVKIVSECNEFNHYRSLLHFSWWMGSCFSSSRVGQFISWSQVWKETFS